ncbi:MAG: hypothetical protein ACREDF_00010 [Thermoplasmata archaeon]
MKVIFCRVCRRNVDRRKVTETTIRAKLCGWVAYGACVCGMEVDNPKDRNYRRRVRRVKNGAHGRAHLAPTIRGISKEKGIGKP